MKLRKAALSDLSAIEQIYEDAKTSLRERGINQWQDGYPNRESAKEDIESGTGYVLEENGMVVATACLAFGTEPTYETVYEGAWEGNGDYGFLHRVAVLSAKKGGGAASLFLDELKRQAKDRGISILRGDTHEENLPMQRVLEKNGFSRKGIIYLTDGSRRAAYEWIEKD